MSGPHYDDGAAWARAAGDDGDDSADYEVDGDQPRYLPPLPAPSLPPEGADDPTLPMMPFGATAAQSNGASAAAQAGAPLLDVRAITVTYGQIVAVRDLSLAVRQGEVVALLGANGAGKTTTLRTISGLLRPRHGAIIFAGERIDKASPERIARMGIAHLPEGRGIFARLSVRENLRMAAYGAGATAQEYEERLARALELFPVLKERLGQLAGTLSGGQQQMLAVGRALVTRPKLLMIDELSFGLAPVVVQQLFGMLPQITRDGTAILLVEQFVGQALAVASQAYVLEKGALTFAGPAAELAKREGFVASSYLGGAAQRPGYTRLRDDETEMLRVRVEPAIVRRLRAAGEGRPVREIVNEALASHLAQVESGRQNATGGARQNGSQAGAPAAPRATDPRRGGDGR
ncbi:MAG TPA: ABC transporter ATP-binding protein [Ktedonobacterales bacterium]